jgi:hypothetical protein
VGLVKVKDSETGYEQWIDTSDPMIRESYQQWWFKHQENLSNVFSKAGVDSAQFFTGQDYVRPLIQLFEKR